MSNRQLEAARDGVRLVMADLRRLESALNVDDGVVDAEMISTLLHRAATVASRAASIVATLSDGLAKAVRAEREDAYAEGKRDGKETANEAWASGVDAGMELLRPMDRATPETDGGE
jgi:hypothetical protein